MARFKRPRVYSRRLHRKYRQDPFAFLVLWSLFFSVVFLIFAFRGLIASVFISKIDISNELPEITEEQLVNDAENSTESPAN